jgi:hypothetical protein
VNHTLQYKFQKGEVLVYDKEVTLLLQEPDGKKLGGKTSEEMIQQISEDHSGSWTILLKMKTLHSEGPLCEAIPQDLRERSVIMRMDYRGSLLDLGQSGPPPQVPAFPMEAVHEGQSWLATAPSPDGATPMEIHYHLERFEETEDDLIAHLVTVSQAAQPDQGYTSETQGSVQFSIRHGHQVGSTTVVQLTFEDGRVTHSVVELLLRSRTSG